MKKIPLTRGLFALVDDRDFARLNLYKWHVRESNASFYAVRNKTLNPKPRGSKVVGVKRKRIKIAMHNLIMQPGLDEVVHHKNGNGLDCQRHNMVLTDLCGNNQYAADKRKENSQREEVVPF